MNAIWIVVFFFVFLIITLGFRRLMDWSTNGKHLMKHIAQAVYLSFLFFAFYSGKVDALYAALLGLFGILLIECFTSLLRFLKFGEPIGYERNFGGLGGGMSGWELTGSTSYLLLSIILIASLVVVALDLNKDKAADDSSQARVASTNASSDNAADSLRSDALENSSDTLLTH